jgi:hypothetical protein
LWFFDFDFSPKELEAVVLGRIGNIDLEYIKNWNYWLLLKIQVTMPCSQKHGSLKIQIKASH